MSLVTGSHTVINKHPQLNVCIESATLKLITGERSNPARVKVKILPNILTAFTWLINTFACS
jgi:hypothetical protein